MAKGRTKSRSAPKKPVPSTEEVDRAVSKALAALVQEGLLLLHDAGLPSLATIVAGVSIEGSWWGHPKGRLIFRVGRAFEEDDNVLVTRLIAGKVTFVHRRLWPDVIAIGQAREPWQMGSLKADATRLLERVDVGAVRATGKPAKALQERLLVHAREVHTPSGAHAVELVSWKVFLKEKKLRRKLPTPAAARKRLHAAVENFQRGQVSRPLLPWHL